MMMTPDQYPTRRSRQAVARHDGGRASAALKAQRGHSLVELLIVMVIIVIVAGLAFTRFSGRDDGVRLGQDVARRIRERRAAAIQLNALTAATQLEQFVQPPVRIDFADAETTRSLRLEGKDADRDGYEDTSGLALTHFVAPQAAGATGTGTESWAVASDSVYRASAGTVPRTVSDASMPCLSAPPGPGSGLGHIDFTPNAATCFAGLFGSDNASRQISLSDDQIYIYENDQLAATSASVPGYTQIPAHQPGDSYRISIEDTPKGRAVCYYRTRAGGQSLLYTSTRALPAFPMT